MERQRIRILTLIFLLAMFFSAPVVYGMGGGGGGGGGGFTYTSSAPQSANPPVSHTNSNELLVSNNTPATPVPVPEPISAMLLGGSIVAAAAVMRKKLTNRER